MKSAVKYAISDLLKMLFSPKVMPEIRAEIPVYVVHTTFLANRENSCAHTTFCFFKFTKNINFLSIKFS